MSGKKTVYTRKELLEILRAGKADADIMKITANLLEKDVLAIEDLRSRVNGLRYINDEYKRQLDVRVRWSDE